MRPDGPLLQLLEREGLFIDECMISVRTSGGHHPVHSGGYKGAMRGAYRYKDGLFRCGEVGGWGEVGPLNPPHVGDFKSVAFAR